MGAFRTAYSLLARFSLCFTLIACLWIVSISYRIGPFEYQGGDFWVPNNSGAFAASDGLFLAAMLALLTGLLGLYRSGRISAVLMVLVSLLIVTAIDHVWALHGEVDEYKSVPAYIVKPAIAAVLICPLAFLFPARRDASDRVLALCWAAFILTVYAIVGHMLPLQSMIGSTYVKDVFLCMLACEALSRMWRWWLTHRADLLLYP